jgi:hypothetical protein
MRAEYFEHRRLPRTGIPGFPSLVTLLGGGEVILEVLDKYIEICYISSVVK